jgi:hypothetical protein
MAPYGRADRGTDVGVSHSATQTVLTSV